MAIPDFQSREEAVAFLQGLGFHAFVRDWVLGETIGVASIPFECRGIQGWKRMVYIASSPEGWILHNLMLPGVRTVAATSLRQACKQAIKALDDGPRIPGDKKQNRRTKFDKSIQRTAFGRR